MEGVDKRLKQSRSCDYVLDDEGGQKAQTSSYKIIKSWGLNVEDGDIVNNTVLYICRE